MNDGKTLIGYVIVDEKLAPVATGSPCRVQLFRTRGIARSAVTQSQYTKDPEKSYDVREAHIGGS